jgi:hypothetical protein
MIFLDFEYNNTKEKYMNVVCCCVIDGKTGGETSFWLHKQDKTEFVNYLKSKKDQIFVAYNAVAEASAMFSLGLNPLDFMWIDLFLEYRCLSNNNDNLRYGKQLKDGQIIQTKKPKPKWERTEEDAKTGFKQTHSLAEATFKLCEVIIDSERKNAMRDLIISSPEDFTEQEQKEILEYCMSDVTMLNEIYVKELAHYRKLYGPKYDEKELEGEMLLRGRYAAHTAIMEREGYPIDLEATKNFSNAVPQIIDLCQREINYHFPGTFKWKRAENKFAWNQNFTRKWIEENHTEEQLGNWMATESGQLSLSLEAWERFYPFKHEYPMDNFGAQIVRFLKLKQSLNGFTPKTKNSKTRSFWEYVGSDGRVRPYMNIYAAQSSRSQPASSGFLFLKPAWVRSLCAPQKGKIIGGADFGSQEYFLQALVSEDEAMIKDYLGGDIYLAYAKRAKFCPETATKDSHKRERNLAKPIVLGIGFLMTKIGLSQDLSQKLNREVSEDEAQEYIDLFYNSYPKLKAWQDKFIQEYKNGKYFKLPCGFPFFKDSDNFRSSTNAPIQGRGASIMRKAVDLCAERGLKVIFTLHDALYIEFDFGDWKSMDILMECMTEAFHFYFKGKMKEYAKQIRIDPYMWGPGLKQDGEIITPANNHVHTYEIYIDDRAGDEYKKFSKYFKPNGEEECL